MPTYGESQLVSLYKALIATVLLSSSFRPVRGFSATSACKDFEPDCKAWAARGECGSNPYFMRRQCRNVSLHYWTLRRTLMKQSACWGFLYQVTEQLNVLICRVLQSCKACSEVSASRVWRGYATEVGTRRYVASIPGLRSPTGAGHFRKDISMGSFDTPGKPAVHIQLTSHRRARLLVVAFRFLLAFAGF